MQSAPPSSATVICGWSLVAELAHQRRQVRGHLHLAALVIVPGMGATVPWTFDTQSGSVL